MTEPKPIEYELEDHDAKPPETEAEALARMQREDEEKAKRMGLVKEKGKPLGSRWQDGIGGNSANGSAMRLMEQEARLAERQRQARAATLKTIVVSSALLVALVVGGALAADYTGLAHLGIVGKSKAEVEAEARAAAVAAQPPPPMTVAEKKAVAFAAPIQEPVREAAPKPRLQVLAIAGPAEPEENPPSEAPPTPTVRGPVEAPAVQVAPVDSPERKRAQKRVEAAQRGVTSTEADLAEKQGQIIANIKALYGMVPEERDTVPARAHWLPPCAMLDLEQAQAAKARSSTPTTVLAAQTAQANVNNITAALKHNRGVEKDILGRLKTAQRKLDEAKAELESGR